MKVKKKCSYEIIDLELEKIEEHPNYGIYQVYKIINDKKIPLYKECFDNMQIHEIVKNKNFIVDEEFK